MTLIETSKIILLLMVNMTAFITILNAQESEISFELVSQSHRDRILNLDWSFDSKYLAVNGGNDFSILDMDTLWTYQLDLK